MSRPPIDRRPPLPQRGDLITPSKPKPRGRFATLREALWLLAVCIVILAIAILLP